jgi:oligopeptidase B
MKGLLLALATGIIGCANGVPQPPVAAKVPHVTEIHGQKLIDEYHWMREKSDPKVLAHLAAENAYTEAVMQPTKALQETLYREMLARIKEDDTEVPFRKDDWLYYTRFEKGKQYGIRCRKPLACAHAAEQITLDPNELARGKKFVSVRVHDVSDDGHLLAYTVDYTGFREFTLYVKDLRTGAVIDKVTRGKNNAVWAADNRTIFYLGEDSAKRAYQLWRHTVGTDEKDDQLVYEEKDRLFELQLERSRSRAFVVLTSASFTSSDVRVIRADHPLSEGQLIVQRKKDREAYVDHRGNEFYIRVNDTGRNFRLVAAPMNDPREQNWRELIAHRPEVMLEGVYCFAGHAVVSLRQNALPSLVVLDDSGKQQPMKFDEPIYAVWADRNEQFDTPLFRISFQSYTTPRSVYDVDVKTGKRELLKRQPVLGGYDPSKYAQRRIVAKASDGTDVPISMVWRSELQRDGQPQAMLLSGYGSYGAPMDARFNSNVVSLLDRGVIFAVAHIRGGGDFGKTWHDRGKMMHKKNTFNDFIAAADHLVNERYTTSDRLVIEGGSAGGLLMGACLNMRPELFRAVVMQVPFVDVINTMLDESLPLTYPEFQEWGNPKVKEQFDYMLDYSPYDNIEPKKYSNVLAETSLNDSQVMYWEPAKFVAKLRATMQPEAGNTVLLKSRLEPAGHGGASGRYDRLRETAFTYAYILSQLGLTR